MEHYNKEKHYSLSRQHTVEGTVSWGPPFPYSGCIRMTKEREFQENERFLRHQLAIRHGALMVDPMASSRMIRAIKEYKR